MSRYPSSGWAVEADGLVKTFGRTRAVDGVDLQVATGSSTGCSARTARARPRRSRMLATLLRPDAGGARVFGHDVVREPQIVRQLIGLTGQYASLDEALSGVENLVLFSRLLGLGRGAAKRKAGELLEEFGLSDAATKPVTQYSGGMRRRLDLAASLIAQPPLIFLDEPTTGLDPRTRGQMWDTIRRLVATGSTVLLTTQYLDEADQLADRIAVIDRGRVVAEGTADELKASVGESSLQLRLRDAADLDDAPSRSSACSASARRLARGRSADRADGRPRSGRRPAGHAARGGHPPRRAERPEADARRGVPRPHRPRRRNRRAESNPLESDAVDGRGIRRDRRQSRMTTVITPGADRDLRNSVSLRQTLSNSFTMAWRGLLKIKRTPEQLFDVTFQPIMFTVMFTYIFGGAIAGTPEDYLPFIVPGILVQTVITTSVVTGVQLREDMAKGVFDRFRSLPIARVAPLAGPCSPTPCATRSPRSSPSATAFMMGFRPDGGSMGVGLAAVLVIVSAWSLSWIFAFFGVIARSAERCRASRCMILFPLTFLSNASCPSRRCRAGSRGSSRSTPSRTSSPRCATSR